MREPDAWLDSFVYLPERDQSFTNDRCFLCGMEVDETTGTDEHIFPKWLLNEFALWDERVTLLNRITIPYRRLVIPCCITCNTKHLKAVEDAVSTAYRKGPDDMQALDRDLLFLWMGKILYGLMFRELFLAVDRTQPSMGPIMVP